MAPTQAVNFGRENMRLFPILAVFAMAIAGCVQLGGPAGIQPTITPGMASKSPVDIDGRYVRGSPTGPVLIVEYSDFECQFCSEAALTIDKLVQAYPGQIALVYKHFPLTAQHPHALKAAEAFECAGEQGKAWEMHDEMFKHQNALGVDDLTGYSSKVGINSTQFRDCLVNNKKAAIVGQDLAEATRRGLDRTPTFFIDNKRLVGAQPYDSFRAVIEGELNPGNSTSGVA